MRNRRVACCVLAAALAISGLSGCGSAGPEVKLAPEAAGWTPVRVALLAPAVKGDATGTLKTLPEGLAMPTREEAGEKPLESFETALRALKLTVTVFSVSSVDGQEAADAAGKLSGQYLDTRSIDPALAVPVGEAVGADAIILLAVLRYGPETDPDIQQMSQNANATVGTTDLAISSTATRTVVWFNAHLRAALVRVSDGLVVWDASMRVRNKRTPLGDVSLESAVRDAGTGLASVFPWVRDESGETQPVLTTPAAQRMEVTAPSAPSVSPAAETPAAETPAAETPAVEAPTERTPAANTPAANTPAANTPAANTPAANTPAANTPAANTPAANTPAPTTPEKTDR